jgi:hypothetical protein
MENDSTIEDQDGVDTDDFEASRQLAYHHKARPIREILLELADATDPELEPGHYGEGEVVERLEKRGPSSSPSRRREGVRGRVETRPRAKPTTLSAPPPPAAARLSRQRARQKQDTPAGEAKHSLRPLPLAGGGWGEGGSRGCLLLLGCPGRFKGLACPGV